MAMLSTSPLTASLHRRTAVARHSRWRTYGGAEGSVDVRGDSGEALRSEPACNSPKRLSTCRSSASVDSAGATTVDFDSFASPEGVPARAAASLKKSSMVSIC